MCYANTFFHNQLGKWVNAGEHVKPSSLPAPWNSIDIHFLLPIFCSHLFRSHCPDICNCFLIGVLAIGLSPHLTQMPYKPPESSSLITKLIPSYPNWKQTNKQTETPTNSITFRIKSRLLAMSLKVIHNPVLFNLPNLISLPLSQEHPQLCSHFIALSCTLFSLILPCLYARGPFASTCILLILTVVQPHLTAMGIEIVKIGMFGILSSP